MHDGGASAKHADRPAPLMGESLQVTVLREIPEDIQSATSWNDLAMRMERPEVFYTHQWALAASHAFAETLQPLVCLVYDSNRLCGVAPLAATREVPHHAFFLTASTADYCDVLSEPNTRKVVLAAIFDEIGKLGVQDITLANVPSDSATLRELPGIARSRHFHMYDRAAYDCGLVLLGSSEERKTLLESVKSKDREKRGLKKLTQLGAVRLAHGTIEQVEPDLASIFSAHISRFLATQRISPFVRRERRAFLTELSHLLSQAGWLKISRLEIDGRPVAWNYGFRFYDSWFWYLPTFETQFEDASPGSCLLRLLVGEACSDPSVKRLDLGLGDEQYKVRFANAVRPTRHVQLSTGTLRHWQTVSRHQLAAGIKRFRGIDRAIRKTRDLSRDLKNRIRATGAVSTGAHMIRRASKYLVSNDEVLLFDAPPMEPQHHQIFSLAPLDWKLLADAAIDYAEDSQTLQYLMRCASRLRSGEASGHVLRSPDSDVLHFLWITQYDGFYLSEIDYQLAPTDANADTIFDCWTPVRHRGHGYYTAAIRLAAEGLQRQQKQVWIFCAATNESSVRGILKAGFIYRFSLVRRKTLVHSKVTRRLKSA